MNPPELVSVDLQGAVDELAAPACAIDRDGRFSWVNRAFVETFGDLRGKPFIERVAPEDRQLARTNFTRKVVGKTTDVFDMRVVDKDGTLITMRTTSAPLRRGGQVVGVFGIGIPLRLAPADERSPLDELTPRQLEVLRLLAEGLETPQIAQRLGIAEETARNHIRALLRTTGAHSRLEVVLMGFRLGLVDAHLTQPGQQESEEETDN